MRALTSIVMVVLLTGCGAGTSTDSEAQSTPPDGGDAGASIAPGTPSPSASPQGQETAPAPADDEAPALANQQQYLAFLAAALDWSYELAPDDGTVEVLQSTQEYGSLRWTSHEIEEVGIEEDEIDVVVAHRSTEAEWEWVYTEDRADVAAVTPAELTAEETAAFQALADALLSAVDEEGPAVVRYGYKEPGGVSQADFVVATTHGEASLHVAADGEGRIGRIDLRWLAS